MIDDYRLSIFARDQRSALVTENLTVYLTYYVIDCRAALIAIPLRLAGTVFNY